MIENVKIWCEELRETLISKGFKAYSIASSSGIAIEGFVKRSASLEAPIVYVSSGVHGDEPAGPLAIERLVANDFFHSDLSWIVCPMLNPSGHMAGTRENAEGIDLNRDYYFLKSTEVQGHVAWLETQEAPSLMLSLHEDWESSGYYFYEINTQGDQPTKARTLMDCLDKTMLREADSTVDGHEVREPGWIYHEAIADEFQCWPEAIFMAKKMGCPVSLTMESPSSSELEKRIVLQMEFVRTAVSIWT